MYYLVVLFCSSFTVTSQGNLFDIWHIVPNLICAEPMCESEKAHKHNTQQFKSVCMIRVISNCRIRVMMYQFPWKYRTGVKKSFYVLSGTNMNKPISKDGIESTPRYYGFLSDEECERTPKTRMVSYAFLRAHPQNSPKTCPVLCAAKTYYSYVNVRLHLCRKTQMVCFPREEKKSQRAPLDRIEGCGVSAIRGLVAL